MFRLRLRGQWLVPIILSIASQVSACPVCGVGRDGTASVYLMTAVLMCTVPLMMFGAMAYYLFRQSTHDQYQQHEPASSASPPHRFPAHAEGKSAPGR
jgi:hypothetical protein